MAASLSIKEQLQIIPDLPGIYKYFDKNDTIIYVGKAKSLKKRVSSYFNKVQHDNRKTSVLVKQIVRIEFTVVDSEMDALLLENSLIKEFQPRYNINLKDDKSYPFIKITKDRFPKVYAMRNPVKDGSEYFGPYASPKVMHIVLDFVKKLYPIRNCNLNLTEENINAGKFRICLEYQIGNCHGPCEGKQSEENYNESIANIRYLLKGNLSEVRKQLKDKMQTAAANLQFEKAQNFKEKLLLLDKYQHKSSVVSQHVGDVEVYTVSSDSKNAFVNFLRVCGGFIVTTRNLEFRKKLEESDDEIIQMAIVEMRTTYPDSATNEIILANQLELDSKDFSITVPKAGEKRKLLELSMKNALLYRREKQNQNDKLNPDSRVERIMELMKKDLNLKEQPRHMECFDNSNFHGTYPVSACVVFKDGKPSKSDYRHFNVKTVVGPDDFATMKEVILRRYSRLVDENAALPQLIIIDGGKGQLGAAVEALKELKLYGKLAIIGIAKRLEEIYFPDDSLPLYIDKKSETLKIIQQMRDEAHRFGITHHRSRRDKGTLKTTLTEIKGIGTETADTLLKHFKSVKKVFEAEKNELESVVGKAKAKLIVDFVSERNENDGQ